MQQNAVLDAAPEAFALVHADLHADRSAAELNRLYREELATDA
jgi:hypothetical protein